MTELSQFVVDAIKTESKIEQVTTNKELLIQTISILVHAGNILDQIKKNVFYAKPFAIDDLVSHTQSLNESVNLLNKISTNDIVDNKSDLGVNPRIFHSIVGISTEATELLEALDINGQKMDSINIAEEFGDIDWYKAIGVDELAIDWVTILTTVIQKLKTRYPDAFTSEDAINRDLEKEREVLDEMETSKT